MVLVKLGNSCRAMSRRHTLHSTRTPKILEDGSNNSISQMSVRQEHSNCCRRFDDFAVKMMKAVLLDKPGEPLSLRYGDIAVPKMMPGDVLIKVHACALNPVDWKICISSVDGWEYPHIPGVDASGVIVDISDGTCIDNDGIPFHKGDAVVFHGDLRRQGGLAEYVVAKATAVSRKPEKLTHVQAASIPCAGYTAFQGLFEKAHVGPGMDVLITGGAGGVGGFAIQLAKAAGANKIITTCRGSKHDYCYSLGATHTIDYCDADVIQRVFEITGGRGVDVLLDTISPDQVLKFLRAGLVAANGHLIPVAPYVYPTEPDMIKMTRKQISLHTIFLGPAAYQNDEKSERQLSGVGIKMLNMYANGQCDMNAVKINVIKLEEAATGLDTVRQGRVEGKIVVQLL